MLGDWNTAQDNKNCEDNYKIKFENRMKEKTVGWQETKIVTTIGKGWGKKKGFQISLATLYIVYYFIVYACIHILKRKKQGL